MYDKQIHVNMYLDLQHMYLRNDVHGVLMIHEQAQKFANHENMEMPKNE